MKREVKTKWFAGGLIGLALFGFQQQKTEVTRAAEQPIAWVSIQGPIDVTASALIQRALREARSQKASTLIIEIDTEGGEVEKMWQIARPLSEANDIETVAFINRKAISAGAYIAIACKKIYMVPSASIGAAMPVMAGPQGMQPVAEDKEVRAKIYAAFRADLRAIAEQRNRNASIAEAMVDPEVGIQKVQVDGEIKILKVEEIDDLIQKGQVVKVMDTIQAKGSGPLSITAESALSYNFIDGIAEDREKLLKWLGLETASFIEFNHTWSEDLVRYLNAMAPILMILGFVLAFVETKIPGFGIFGILSMACFALLFFGNYLAGLADVFHIVLFILGIGLILVEIFVLPGYLIFGALGFIAVIYGLVSSFLGFYWPSHQLDYQVLNMTAKMFGISLGIILISILILAWAISKYLPNIPFLGRSIVMPVEPGTFQHGGAPISEMAVSKYLHKSGVAATDLRPAGKIEINGQLLDAQSSGGFIEQGRSVRVVEVSTNRIVVEEGQA